LTEDDVGFRYPEGRTLFSNEIDLLNHYIEHLEDKDFDKEGIS
jgi:hypothetical protein